MQSVYRFLREAREEGTIPWEWIVDDQCFGVSQSDCVQSGVNFKHEVGESVWCSTLADVTNPLAKYRGIGQGVAPKCLMRGDEHVLAVEGIHLLGRETKRRRRPASPQNCVK
jgi:hypothetical protein